VNISTVGPAARAYSYVRFSTPEQSRGDSKTRQLKMGVEAARRLGLPLDADLKLHDTGVSAFRGLNRDIGALGEFIKHIDDGVVAPGSALIVENMDRLTRETVDEATDTLKAIVRKGVGVYDCSDGTLYTAASIKTFEFVKLAFRMVLSNEESAKKQKRNREAWIRKRESGKVMTGLVPAWIRKTGDKLELIPERAAIVRRIFESYVRGDGKQKIALDLIADGIPPFGKGHHGKASTWHQSYIRNVLANPAAYGSFTPHVEERAVDARTAKEGPKERVAQAERPDYYPPVVDKDVWSQVQAMSEAKAPVRAASTKPGAVVSIVAGLALCPACGSKMTRVYKGSKAQPVARLVCSAAKAGRDCPYVSVRIDEVTRALVQLAGVELPKADQVLAEDIRNAEAALEGVLEQIEQLADALVLGPSKVLSVRLAAYEATADKIRANLAELQKRALETDSMLVKRRAERLRIALSAVPLDVGKANAALRECLRSVTVDHTRGVLVLNWRHDGTTELDYDAEKRAAVEFEDFSKVGAP